MPLDGTHFSKNRPVSDKALNPQSGHACFMLTEIYIEALLVDGELADQVWEAWNAENVSDAQAEIFWSLIVLAAQSSATTT